MVLFAIGVRRGPRGFALKFKNSESYVADRTDAQNPGLRSSLLLAVSFDLLRAPIWEQLWHLNESFLRSRCAVVLVDLRFNSKSDLLNGFNSKTKLRDVIFVLVW